MKGLFGLIRIPLARRRAAPTPPPAEQPVGHVVKHPTEEGVVGFIKTPLPVGTPLFARPRTDRPRPFQSDIDIWMLACFGSTIAADKDERNYRFLEEAIEVVQAAGCSKADALALVDYVFDRPNGEVFAEVGGAGVTRAASTYPLGVAAPTHQQASIPRRLLAGIAAGRPVREYYAEVLGADGEPACDAAGGEIRAPLFRRYFLFRFRGYTYYLHHYLRSDPDRGPHCHPWKRAYAIPLIGGYVEERLDGFGPGGMRMRRRRRRALRPYRLRQADFHRLLLAPGETSWSIFAHSPEVSGWGFLRHAGGCNGVHYVPFKMNATPEDAWWEWAQKGRELEQTPP